MQPEGETWEQGHGAMCLGQGEAHVASLSPLLVLLSTLCGSLCFYSSQEVERALVVVCAPSSSPHPV